VTLETGLNIADSWLSNYHSSRPAHCVGCSGGECTLNQQ